MSDFDWIPLAQPSVTKSPRVKTAQFGDGYQQRVADGINTIAQVWNLNFRSSKAVIDAIDAFLALKNGATSFTWTPPNGTEIKVTCASWARTLDGKSIHSLSATFQQVFE